MRTIKYQLIKVYEHTHRPLKFSHDNRYAYAVCKTTFEEGFDFCGFATFRMSLYIELRAFTFMELSRTNLQHFTDFRMALFRNFANHIIKLDVFL